MATIDELLGQDKLLGLATMTREQLEIYLKPVLSLEPKPIPQTKVKEVFGAIATKVEEKELVDDGSCPIKRSKPKITKKNKGIQYDLDLSDEAINNL